MSVSRSPAPSSIDLSGVPARVAEAVAQVVAVCHEQFRSDPCPEAFEEAELRVRETMNALACELLGAVIEKRDDGASRIERDGQSWFRVVDGAYPEARAMERRLQCVPSGGVSSRVRPMISAIR